MLCVCVLNLYSFQMLCAVVVCRGTLVIVSVVVAVAVVGTVEVVVLFVVLLVMVPCCYVLSYSSA